ncbi:MAG: DUF4476 domain-containing protein [Myxococcota bacterium]
MLVWWALSANAGEITFLLSTPVQVQVDGIHVDTLTSNAITAKDLAAGAHTVRILDMMSKPVLSQEVTVAADESVVLRYKSKTLTEQSRGKLGDAPSSALTPMSESAFAVLLEHVEGASSDAARLDLVRYAATLFPVSVSQTASLMGAFEADANKIAAVEILKPKLTDPSGGAALSAQVSAANRPKIEAMFP